MLWPGLVDAFRDLVTLCRAGALVLALSCINTTAAVAKARHHYCFEVHAGGSV